MKETQLKMPPICTTCEDENHLISTEDLKLEWFGIISTIVIHTLAWAANQDPENETLDLCKSGGSRIQSIVKTLVRREAEERESDFVTLVDTQDPKGAEDAGNNEQTHTVDVGIDISFIAEKLITIIKEEMTNIGEGPQK